MVSENPRHSPGEQGNTATDKLVPHAGIRACRHAGMRMGNAHTYATYGKLHGIGVILMDHEALMSLDHIDPMCMDEALKQAVGQVIDLLH